MEMNSTNKAISSALVKAQKGFAPALKTSLNPHFKSKYADLAACVEAVLDSLNENGIYLMQPTYECENGVIVETVFIHESGEQISAGKLHVPATKNDPQGYGSALSYARRYSLMAACGIAPEDDDGNAASKRVIAPVKAAMQGVQVNDEDAKWLREIAATLVYMVEDQNKISDAYDYMTKQGLDGDQKLALWEILAPNSKTRGALKKEGQSRQAAAKTPPTLAEAA